MARRPGGCTDGPPWRRRFCGMLSVQGAGTRVGVLCSPTAAQAQQSLGVFQGLCRTHRGGVSAL
eukprot:6297277-Prymnesium_polylepis.1